MAVWEAGLQPRAGARPISPVAAALAGKGDSGWGHAEKKSSGGGSFPLGFLGAAALVRRGMGGIGEDPRRRKEDVGDARHGGTGRSRGGREEAGPGR